MICPSPEISQEEKILSISTIKNIECLNEIHLKEVGHVDNLIQGEVVSFSKEFGYIYRYIKFIEGDGDEYLYKFSYTIVNWTSDGKSCNRATYPNFRLGTQESIRFR